MRHLNSVALLTSTVVLLALAPEPAAAGVLWYNGDLPAQGGATVNEQADSPVGANNTFDDFVVNDPAGWTIDTVWSNDQMSITGVNQATWSIRSGVSVGNGGTLVAGGTAAATQTPTGRTGGATGFAEYAIEVTGLNVHLAPGTYWLSVSPVVGADPASGLFRSYNSGTLGLNAVNRPPSSLGNGLFNSTFLSFNFANFGNDYSLGVAGTAVSTVIPEPSTLVMGAMAGFLVLGRTGWRRRRA